MSNSSQGYYEAEINAVLRPFKEKVISVPGVIGCGLGIDDDRRYTVNVLEEKKGDACRDDIPSSVCILVRNREVVLPIRFVAVGKMVLEGNS